MSKWLRLPKSSKEGDVIFINNDEVWLTTCEEKLIAVSNICPHKLGPLNLGERESERFIYCPWHGYKFNLITKECINHRVPKLREYDIKNENSELWIKEKIL